MPKDVELSEVDAARKEFVQSLCAAGVAVEAVYTAFERVIEVEQHLANGVLNLSLADPQNDERVVEACVDRIGDDLTRMLTLATSLYGRARVAELFAGETGESDAG